MKVNLDRDEENLVTPQYSQARGPVLRGDNIELTKVRFAAGEGAKTHQHPEEQVVYVLSGRLECVVGGETYLAGPGDVSYHPSNVPHSVRALEDVVGLSFKNLVDPQYEATGRLAER